MPSCKQLLDLIVSHAGMHPPNSLKRNLDPVEMLPHCTRRE